MAKHNNPTISEDTRRIFNLKTGDMLGSDVGNMIVPVIPITRYNNIVRNLTKTDTGLGNVYTNPTDKDFYLTSVIFSMEKNAACDNVTAGVITQEVGNAVTDRDIVTIPSLTLTAKQESIVITYPIPILLRRGYGIYMVGNFTVGNMTRFCSITGYTIETMN